MATISETQSQIDTAKSQAELAKQQIGQYKSSLPNEMAQKLLRAPQGANPLQQQLTRQKIIGAKTQADTAIKQVEDYQSQVGSYEKSFQDYLQTDPGKLQYAKETGIPGTPIYGHTGPDTANQILGYKYQTPYGEVTDYSIRDSLLRQQAGAEAVEFERQAAVGQALGFTNPNQLQNAGVDTGKFYSGQQITYTSPSGETQTVQFNPSDFSYQLTQIQKDLTSSAPTMPSQGIRSMQGQIDNSKIQSSLDTLNSNLSPITGFATGFGTVSASSDTSGGGGGGGRSGTIQLTPEQINKAFNLPTTSKFDTLFKPTTTLPSSNKDLNTYKVIMKDGTSVPLVSGLPDGSSRGLQYGDSSGSWFSRVFGSTKDILEGRQAEKGWVYNSQLGFYQRPSVGGVSATSEFRSPTIQETENIKNANKLGPISSFVFGTPYKSGNILTTNLQEFYAKPPETIKVGLFGTGETSSSDVPRTPLALTGYVLGGTLGNTASEKIKQGAVYLSETNLGKKFDYTTPAKDVYLPTSTTYIPRNQGYYDPFKIALPEVKSNTIKDVGETLGNIAYYGGRVSPYLIPYVGEALFFGEQVERLAPSISEFGLVSGVGKYFSESPVESTIAIAVPSLKILGKTADALALTNKGKYLSEPEAKFIELKNLLRTNTENIDRIKPRIQVSKTDEAINFQAIPKSKGATVIEESTPTNIWQGRVTEVRKGDKVRFEIVKGDNIWNTRIRISRPEITYLGSAQMIDGGYKEIVNFPKVQRVIEVNKEGKGSVKIINKNTKEVIDTFGITSKAGSEVYKDIQSTPSKLVSDIQTNNPLSIVNVKANNRPFISSIKDIEGNKIVSGGKPDLTARRVSGEINVLSTRGTNVNTGKFFLQSDISGFSDVIISGSRKGLAELKGGGRNLRIAKEQGQIIEFGADREFDKAMRIQRGNKESIQRFISPNVNRQIKQVSGSEIVLGYVNPKNKALQEIISAKEARMNKFRDIITSDLKNQEAIASKAKRQELIERVKQRAKDLVLKVPKADSLLKSVKADTSSLKGVDLIPSVQARSSNIVGKLGEKSKGGTTIGPKISVKDVGADIIKPKLSESLVNVSSSDIRLSNKMNEIFAQKVNQPTKEVQQERESLKEMQRAKLSEATKQTQEQKQTQRQYQQKVTEVKIPVTPRPRTPKKIELKLKLPSINKVKSRKIMSNKRGGSFDVAITRRGKVVEFLPVSATYESAKGIAGIELKKSIKASARLVPSSKPAKEYGVRLGNLAPEFRSYKISKGVREYNPLLLIQRASTRLGTRSEVSAIQSARKGGKFRI